MNQLLIGRTCQHVAELCAVIVDNAYVFADDVVHLPVAVHVMEPVIDRKFLPFVVNELCLHLCIAMVFSLA
jgi:hypothetical protein